MRKKLLLLPLLALIFAASLSFRHKSGTHNYTQSYLERIERHRKNLEQLQALISSRPLNDEGQRASIFKGIRHARQSLKQADFWTRYFDALAYKKLNGPLPVEWETEVFEKFEAPYRREGFGLGLAYSALEDSSITADSLLKLVEPATQACGKFLTDSMLGLLNQPGHFYFCNRLFLLNLAAIYSTGFECPDKDQIIPELRMMMGSMEEVLEKFSDDFPAHRLSEEYVELFRKCIFFLRDQPASVGDFDHYTFIRNFVNPLFSLNQKHITRYGFKGLNENDYSLNSRALSIFSKDLYKAQDPKGVFHRVNDPAVLEKIEQLGRQLFYDPLLSSNNLRSCASCHKPEFCFADTVARANLHLNRVESLPRNTPSLVNAGFNHLLMSDGAHYTLQRQARAVITNTAEMGSTEKQLLTKLTHCKDYDRQLADLLKYTPQEPELNMEHICSALTYYYTRFDRFSSPFDEAMNQRAELDHEAVKGFNLFMGKAECATCHFVPIFNGVKPPYTGSEFEVLGTPADKGYRAISPDKGRYTIHPAPETERAFRTGTLRNISRTAPYMHNGVFRSLEEVVDFYNEGGGAGHGLQVPNQTLSADSLKLSETEKKHLVAFMRTLDEQLPAEHAPVKLPETRARALRNRKPGGEY